MEGERQEVPQPLRDGAPVPRLPGELGDGRAALLTGGPRALPSPPLASPRLPSPPLASPRIADLTLESPQVGIAFSDRRKSASSATIADIIFTKLNVE
eukprot:7386297-Prymnesium_polylepis.1